MRSDHLSRHLQSHKKNTLKYDPTIPSPRYTYSIDPSIEQLPKKFDEELKVSDPFFNSSIGVDVETEALQGNLLPN